MATKEVLRWWRDGERLLVAVNGTNVEARWLKFEEQLVTLQCTPYDPDGLTHARSRAPLIEKAVRDERSGLHEADPLFDEGLW